MGFTFTSCTKESEAGLCEGDIKIKFHNTTEADLKNVSINQNQVGVIRKGQSSDYSCFEEFQIDSGMPDCIMFGEYKGANLGSISQFYWCGTQKGLLSNGIYEIEIKVVKVGEKSYFDLQFKE